MADVDSFHIYSLVWLVDAGHPAVPRLGYYPDVEVIAELKKCLANEYRNFLHVADEACAMPRSAEICVAPRAAYESLRRLKAEVPRPELEHPVVKAVRRGVQSGVKAIPKPVKRTPNRVKTG